MAGPTRTAVAGEHRCRGSCGRSQLLDDLGVPRATIVAEQLVMLRAGAMAVASVGNTENIAAALAGRGPH